MPLPPPDELARIQTEVDRLGLERTKAHLASGRWRGEKREAVELWIERKEIANFYRSSAKDRKIRRALRHMLDRWTRSTRQ